MRLIVLDEPGRIVYDARFYLPPNSDLSESERAAVARGDVSFSYHILILEGVFTHALKEFHRKSSAFFERASFEIRVHLSS